MAAFEQLDWGRFDVWGAVGGEGIAVIEPSHRDSCHRWLEEHHFRITTIDFGAGIGPAVVALGELFRWQESFGYSLTAESRNLDALRDGFDFDLAAGQACVLELLNAEVANREDARWFAGLLAIAHEHTIWKLALGSRFFTILVLERESPLIGLRYREQSVPVPYWRGSRRDPFDPDSRRWNPHNE